MSKKYVPAFLKEQQPNPSNTASFWPGGNRSNTTMPTLNTSNKFSALADDDAPKAPKPIVNTSLPAQQAPKLAPATLAALTSNGSVPVATGSSGSGSGPKKSFAAKFKEQVKAAETPGYVPPPKPVDFSSESDFPSLGGPGPKKNTVVLPPVQAPSTQSFAEKAKEWAKKKEEDEEKAQREALRRERQRREAELLRKTMPMIGLKRYGRDEEDEDEDEYGYNNHEESSLGGDSDSYEVPEGDEEPSDEDDEENGEFNQDVGWDGRRRDDLY